MEARNLAFQQLKPACVALSQATLAFTASQSNGQEITDALQRLLKATEALTSGQNSLDEKLADYVFFPLSQVLKISQKLPVQALELSLQVLSIILKEGWREHIAPNLSAQLLILLSFMGEISPSRPTAAHTTNELQTAAFNCFSNLFSSLSLTTAGKSSLTEAANVPSLGHAVMVILSGVTDGASQGVQLAAAKALSSLFECITDGEVLASFLPGIVSAFTKALPPSTQYRRHWTVLTECLSTLTKLLQLTMSDAVVADLVEPNTGIDGKESSKAQTLDSSWVKATASQLKLALANINRLRSHPRGEVREHVLRLSFVVLNDCKRSLSNCASMAAETALIIAGDEAVPSGRRELEILVQTDVEAKSLVENTIHDWMTSLTRIMQSNDEETKRQRLKHTFTAFSILASSRTDMRLLYRLLASNLRDTVSIVLQNSKPKGGSIQSIEPVMLMDLSLSTAQSKSLTFNSSIAQHSAQETILQELQRHINMLLAHQGATSLDTDLAVALQVSQGNARVANFWLLINVLATASDFKDPLDDFIEMTPTIRDHSALMNEVFSFSLSILEDEDAEWRLKMLALEGVALQARQDAYDFRDELVDALYPILQHLSSETPQVRNHAITCLNIVAEACQYANVTEMVVSNVDYLTNAVALKLNAFDVSPQAPQVLLMMVRLAGPSLLPYLEDTVESIFAALEDYHGYTTLVELLFAVLKTMAEEGVRAPQLVIAAGKETEATSNEPAVSSTKDLVSLIRAEADRSLSRKREEDSHRSEVLSFPHRPWKDEHSKPTPSDMPPDPFSGIIPEEDEAATGPEVVQPPVPKTYALLLKITQLTQHYLSSSSASLRTSLLSLIRTTIPALAKHEDSYLPLVNTLWPEIISRLHDPESHVVAGSLDIIAIMCEYAGAFMRSRIETLWPDLISLHSRLKREMTGANSSSAPASLALTERGHSTSLTYVDPTAQAAWQHFIDTLTAIVAHVAVGAELFEDVLSMLHPVSRVAPDVRKVLARYNADAVWLCELREDSLESPLVRPASSLGWAFAEVAG